MHSIFTSQCSCMGTHIPVCAHNHQKELPCTQPLEHVWGAPVTNVVSPQYELLCQNSGTVHTQGCSGTAPCCHPLCPRIRHARGGQDEHAVPHPTPQPWEMPNDEKQQHKATVHLQKSHCHCPSLCVHDDPVRPADMRRSISVLSCPPPSISPSALTHPVHWGGMPRLCSTPHTISCISAPHSCYSICVSFSMMAGRCTVAAASASDSGEVLVEEDMGWL